MMSRSRPTLIRFVTPAGIEISLNRVYHLRICNPHAMLMRVGLREQVTEVVQLMQA